MSRGTVLTDFSVLIFYLRSDDVRLTKGVSVLPIVVSNPIGNLSASARKMEDIDTDVLRQLKPHKRVL